MAYMNLENAYDRVDMNGLWQILRIHGIGGGTCLRQFRVFIVRVEYVLKGFQV